MIENIISEKRIKLPFIKEYMVWNAEELKGKVLARGGMHKRRPDFEKEVNAFFELNPGKSIDLTKVFRKPGYGKKSRFTKWTGSSKDKYDSSKKQTWTLNTSDEFQETAYTISLVVVDQIFEDHPDLKSLSDWAVKFARE